MLGAPRAKYKRLKPDEHRAAPIESAGASMFHAVSANVRKLARQLYEADRNACARPALGLTSSRAPARATRVSTVINPSSCMSPKIVSCTRSRSASVAPGGHSCEKAEFKVKSWFGPPSRLNIAAPISHATPDPTPQLLPQIDDSCAKTHSAWTLSQNSGNKIRTNSRQIDSRTVKIDLLSARYETSD